MSSPDVKLCQPTTVDREPFLFILRTPMLLGKEEAMKNANGLLREYFPKKSDLAAISDENLNKALGDINHRPRKCLDYRAPFEALLNEIE